MLIPSIDLMNGRVVQLRQGEELMFATDDLDAWLRRFARFPVVQVIDLDAALGRGDNAAIVERLCAARNCQVGGGVRTVERARSLVDAGAARVIVGSALFDMTGVNVQSAAAFHVALGDAFVAAIDSRAGRVAIHGWKTLLPIGPIEAALALDPFAAGFLYTHVDTEGTLSGLDLAPIHRLKEATAKRLIVAGGIRRQEEVDTLDALGIDAVVGMAIYTERMRLQVD
jgi:phosphoribosylformimino-5-aminoimidazole carboxamide ribotide isomerase